MKLVIFGIGGFYSKNKNCIVDEIVAFIDNKATGVMNFENKLLMHPSQWKNLSFDKVLLMSVHKKDMKSQLIDLGMSADCIWSWDEYLARLNSGRIDLYINNIEHHEHRVLVFTESLNYNGGSMTAVYAARALKDRGYEVCLAGGNDNLSNIFIHELGRLKINVAIIYDTPNLLESDLFWIRQFDIVIVNVFQMIKCAFAISDVKPVMWWLHEPNSTYEMIVGKHSDYLGKEKFNNIHVVAVSDIAKDCFRNYFPSVKCGSLLYGIPDEYVPIIKQQSCKNFIFAIIGSVGYIKGQDVFLKAAEMINKDEIDNVEFWIIGGIGYDDYQKSIRNIAGDNPQVKILGGLNRKEMQKVYDEIDVVICASREETMSIVITEGMMHGKICISSSGAGIVKYIVDGENGLVFKSENVEELYHKMKWVFINRNELKEMKMKARRTYESIFSMEAFGGRLEEELIRTHNLSAKK